MKSSTKVWFFLAALSLIAIAVGRAIGGRDGMLWGLAISLSINSIVYFYGDHHVLHRFKGRWLEGQDPWSALSAVERVCQSLRLPRPRVLLVDQPAPQALAVGRSWRHGTLILTQGLVETFTPQEIEAVIAYQAACLQRLDTLAYGVASCFCGFVLTIAYCLDTLLRWLIGGKKNSAQFFTLLVAPLAGALVRLSVSPNGYFEVDRLAAQFLGDAKPLAHALWKLDSYKSTQPFVVPASMAHLFIVNPLTGPHWTRYFQVQPSSESRIKRLIGYYPI